MKKFASLLLLCCSLLLNVPGYADQQTTVLEQKLTIGQAEASLPYIDGNLDVGLEKMANDIVQKKARNLLKQLGDRGDLNYTVTLNRPSVVSVLLRANYNGKTVYDIANLDLTTGKEFGVNEFFVNDDRMQALFGKNEEILFEDKGLIKRSVKDGPFDSFLSYEEILPSIRIGEAGRLLQISRLTANAEGKTLHMKSGNIFAIKLDANPSTGYTWVLKPSSAIDNKIVMVGSSFMLPNVDDNRVGTPGIEISMYAVRAPGTYDVSLEYKRPWEMFVFKKVNFKIIAE